jgi:hypothetical protein
MEDILCFRYSPLTPLRVRMTPVPSIGKLRNLTNRNRLATREPMPITPVVDLAFRAEGQHHRTMLVYVIPGSCWGYCEVDAKIVESDWLPFNCRNDERLAFAHRIECGCGLQGGLQRRLAPGVRLLP